MHKLSLNTERKLIKDLDIGKLRELILHLDEPRFRAVQLFREIYQNRIKTFADANTIPKTLREKLNTEYHLHSIETTTAQHSTDGTIKFLFKLINGDAVESVLIPSYDQNDDDLKRLTLCVSSQVGCALNCAFCATGKLKLTRNLCPAEIVDQVLFVESYTNKRITNIVFMGMGEPLHNFDNVITAINILSNDICTIINRKRITLSTSGLVNKIYLLAELEKPVKLAVSLHATTNGLREKLMPINKKWDISALRQAVEFYYKKTGIPITFEYILFDGLNNSIEDAKRLAKFVRSIPSKVNIIPFHEISFIAPEISTLGIKPANRDSLNSFVNLLRDLKVNAFLRTSSGFDIDAACGQLAFSDRATLKKSELLRNSL